MGRFRKSCCIVLGVFAINQVWTPVAGAWDSVEIGRRKPAASEDGEIVDLKAKADKKAKARSDQNRSRNLWLGTGLTVGGAGLMYYGFTHVSKTDPCAETISGFCFSRTEYSYGALAAGLVGGLALAAGLGFFLKNEVTDSIEEGASSARNEWQPRLNIIPESTQTVYSGGVSWKF